MNHSGDAAEQMVRMSLDGVEVAAKITGSAAKEIAVFLVAALKNKDKNIKLKGKTRLTSMLKSGKSLEIFSVKEGDLKNFMQGAKQYGIVYCVLRNTKNNSDGLCDIMVKADDAPKISRLVERFKLATVDKAKVETDLVTEKNEKPASTEPESPDIGDTEKLLNELLGTDEGKSEQKKPVKESDNRPFADKPPQIRPSEPISESRNKSARAIMGKPSVKEELREITAAIADRIKNTPTVITHKQLPVNGKIKYKKSEERF